MKKIILVDDEPLTLKYLEQDVMKMDNEWEVVNSFYDSIDAYEWLTHNTVDLILTDIKMPGMTGLELCEKIIDLNPEQYIVIISGYDEFEFAQEAISLGVKGYLLKPISSEKLELVLNKASMQLSKAYTYNSSSSDDALSPVTESSIIIKAKEYIQHNYQKQISLSEVAQELHISANYLSTLFHQELGQSYINYLTALRLEKATAIIKAYPRKKIYEIADEVGYISVKHFIHVFKRKLGVSPGEYQKQVLESLHL